MLRSSRLLSRGYCYPLDSNTQNRHLSKKSELPPGLSQKLIKGKRNKFSVPELEKSLSLGRNLGQAKLNPDDFFNMISKFKVPEISCDSSNIDELVKMINEIKEDKEMKLSKGIQYFKCLYLIIEEFEKRAQENQTPMKFDDFSLTYTQWLAYFVHNKTKISQEIMKENLIVISDKLILDLEQYASEYRASKSESGKLVKSQNFQENGPKVFDLGNIEEFCTKLIDINKNIFSQTIVYQILTYKSAALWNSGNYSDSMENISTVLEFYCNNLKNEEIRIELGKHVIMVLSKIVSTICENNMTPAVQYLEVILQRIDNKVPIIPYVLSLHYEETPELAEKLHEMSKKHPMIAQLSDPKVSKSLKNKDSARVNQIFFIEDMLKRIEVEKFLEVPKDNINVSPETMQNMTDITILEYLQAGKIKETLSIIERERLIPSMEVTVALVKDLQDTESLHLLENLRHTLPIDSPMYEFVCQQEVKYKTKEVYKIWTLEKHTEALEKMLQLYTLVVENEYQVSDELVTILMRNTLYYLKYFMEVLLYTKDDTGNLRIIDTASKTLILAHDNYDLRSLYWETFFFSDKFNHQSYADEMFQENPQLPRHLDYDHLQSRAQKYERENYFNKLLEISLQFDLSDYEKSLSFDGLVVFYCLRGNLKLASDTMARAQSLGFSTSADAMKIYLELRNIHQTKKQSSIFHNLSELFRSDTSNKK